MKTFRDICCSQLGITNETFEQMVLMQCIPRYHALLAKIIWKLKRSYFNPDQLVLRSLADCTTVQQINVELHYHHRQEAYCSGFFRGTLRFRLSGRRLIKFARKYLPEK